MKTIFIIIGILILMFAAFYGCTHKVVYETVYPRKVNEIESIFLSRDGKALVKTTEGYLIVSLIPQFENYPFGVDSKNEIKPNTPIPNWSEMKPGIPPKELLTKFEEIPIIRDGIEATKFEASHDMRKIDALVVFENEYFAYGQAFACIHFRLYSDRPIFPTKEPKIFTVELPSKLKWHMMPDLLKING